MLLEGLLSKDIEDYGVLKITKNGEAFKQKAKIVQDRIEQPVRRGQCR